MKKRDWVFLFLLIGCMIVTAACGKDGLKETEYFIGEEWRTCSQPATEECGVTLLCGDEVYTCMTNVRMR